MSKGSTLRTSLGAAAVAVVVLAVLTFVLTRPDARTVWERADQALAKDDLETVGKELATLARLREPTPEDDLLAAQYLIGVKRPDEAVERLNRIPDASPLAPRARFQAGQIELRRGRIRKAEQYYRASLELDPKQVRPRRELIYIVGMQSRWKELAQGIRDLGSLVPLTVDDVTLWCLTRSLNWRPEEMTEDLRKWLEADPEDIHSRKALAENLFRRQMLTEAEDVVRGLSVDDPDVRAFVAKLAVDAGRIDQAEALLKEGPVDHAGLAWLRGRIALNKRDGAEALRWFEIAHKADPNDRDAVNGLARALLMLGRNDEAKRYQQLTKDYDALGLLIESLAMNKVKRSPELFKQLGRAYEAVGRIEEAKAWFGLVIGQTPLDSEAQRALFRIGEEEGRRATAG